MMTKEFRRFGKKLLLFVGIGLSACFVLEVGQQVVEALELNRIVGVLNAQPSDSAAVSKVTLPSSLPSSRSTVSRPQGQSAQSPALDFGDRSTAGRPSTIALNTGAASDPQQTISKLSPDQVAVANDWFSASFPVENFQSYTSPFGYRSSPDGGYSQEFHYGLDMAAPEGSYVRNWWGGKVVEVSDDTNCGTSVVLESGSWTHIYCHMQGHVETSNGKRYMIDREGGLQIMEGQEVAAGSRIGRVGMTGRTTGPHLHWGLKFNGNWVDPAYVLRAMYDSQQRAAMQSSASRPQ